MVFQLFRTDDNDFEVFSDDFHVAVNLFVDKAIKLSWGSERCQGLRLAEIKFDNHECHEKNQVLWFTPTGKLDGATEDIVEYAQRMKLFRNTKGDIFPDEADDVEKARYRIQRFFQFGPRWNNPCWNNMTFDTDADIAPLIYEFNQSEVPKIDFATFRTAFRKVIARCNEACA